MLCYHLTWKNSCLHTKKLDQVLIICDLPDHFRPTKIYSTSASTCLIIAIIVFLFVSNKTNNKTVLDLTQLRKLEIRKNLIPFFQLSRNLTFYGEREKEYKSQFSEPKPNIYGRCFSLAYSQILPQVTFIIPQLGHSLWVCGCVGVWVCGCGCVCDGKKEWQRKSVCILSLVGFWETKN